MYGESPTSIWARSPPSNTSSEVLSRALPHTRRCRPSCQLSPSWLTAGPCEANPVRSSAGSVAASAGLPSSSRSISPVEKPLNSTSKSMSISVLKWSCNNSTSHTACSGSRLSAMTTARFSASLKPAIVSVGTSVNPRRLAASRRAWPARMVLVSSIRIGLVQIFSMLRIRRTI